MANHHPSPTMMQMQQQQHQAGVVPPQQQGHFAPSHQIAAMNEAVWLQIGTSHSCRARATYQILVTY